MQKLRRLMKAKRFFVRVMVLFGCALVLTICVISFFLNNHFFRYMQKDAYGMLEQISVTYASQFDGLHQQVNAAASMMTNAVQIKNVFSGKSNDEYDRFAINGKIRSILAQYPCIDSISVIDTRHEFYYNSGIVDKRILQADISDFFEQQGVVPYCFLARSITGASGEALMSMVIPVGYHQVSKQQNNLPVLASGIVINVKADYFFATYLEKRGGIGSDILILNHSGLLCKAASFDTSTLEEILTESDGKLQEEEGQIELHVNEATYMVAYQKEAHYTVMVVEERGRLFASMNDYLRDTYAVIGLILLVSLAGVFFLLRRSYSTVAYVLADVSKNQHDWDLFSYASDEIEYIGIQFDRLRSSLSAHTQKLASTEPYIHKQLIAGLLMGHPAAELPLLSEHFPTLASKHSYQVLALLMRIPEESTLEDGLSVHQITTRLEIEQMASGFLAMHGDMAFVLYESRAEKHGYLCTYIVCGYVQDCQLLSPAFFEPLRMQYEEKGCDVTLCIGCVVKELEEVQRSYQHVLALEKYIFTRGFGSVLDGEELSTVTTSEFLDSFKLKELIDSVRSVQKEKTVEVLDETLARLALCPPEFARLMVNTLYFHVLQTGSGVLKTFTDEELPYNVDEVYGECNNLLTLADVKKHLIAFCEQLMDVITDVQGNQRYQMYRKILSVVERELCNSDLSLAFAAEMVGISSGYAGKIFSSYAGCGFSEYLNNRRVEKAKELLCSTHLSVNEISARVGFQSNTYFITIFKKSTGMTPNSYRRNGEKMSKE
ncbi:MAG: AraC family transcriptional regulator [bacterium]|nr:AraC family transcriptional regulator [bacterium]